MTRRVRWIARGHPLAMAALALPMAACAGDAWAANRALVTGNGLGFAVIHPAQGTITQMLAHPYAYAAPDPTEPLGEGVPTAQFIESLAWRPRDDTAAHSASTVGFRASAHYLRQSQVIHLQAPGGSGEAWMPFGLGRAALVIHWRASRQGSWSVRWAYPVASSKPVRSGAIVATQLAFSGQAESLCLVPLGGHKAASADAPLAASDAWAMAVVEPGEPAAAVVAEVLSWQGGRSPAALLARELRDFEGWRVPVPRGVRTAAELRVWRQGETVLRMAQSREPEAEGRHGTGLVVAALPEGSWATPWVRDMAWATVALVRMGHRAEARSALLAYFRARPTGALRAQLAGHDYQVSVVRYFGNGAEEPWFTQEGATNIELDGWGLALWALGEYLARWRDDRLLAEATHRGTVLESARSAIVQPLLAQLEPMGDGLVVAADTSIWEERQAQQRHFAWTTAAAIAGMRAYARIAGGKDPEGAERATEAAARLERGFVAAFVREGHLRGTLEPGPKNDIDGALPALFCLGVADDPATLAEVLARMSALRVASGGYLRVRSQLADPSVFEYGYERQEFVFVDLAVSGALRRLGRVDEADALLGRVVRDADQHDGLVPEMFVAEPDARYTGAPGDPAGAVPMVGYGAGALAMQWLAMDANGNAR